MAYNTKNYEEQGGAVWHIGGKLVFENGGKIEGGLIEKQDASEATTIAGLVSDFNALLTKLKDSGLMEN